MQKALGEKTHPGRSRLKEEGGKRWEAGKTRQSFGTNCSAKCA